MTEIKISVPLDVNILIHTAAMLTTLAETIDNNQDIFHGSRLASIDTTEEIPPGPVNDTTINDQTVKMSGHWVAPHEVDLDEDGLPWDERIHGEKKSKTVKGGLWKKKRNLDPALLAKVEAELREAMAASPQLQLDGVTTTATTTAPPPPPAGKTVAPPPPAADTITKYITEDGSVYTMDELLAAGWTEPQILERESVEVEIIPEVAESHVLNFAEFLSKVTQAIAAGTLTDEQVNTAVQRQGVAGMPLLSPRPDLMALVHAELFPAG